MIVKLLSHCIIPKKLCDFLFNEMSLMGYPDDFAGCSVAYPDDFAGCSVTYPDDFTGCSVAYPDDFTGCGYGPHPTN